MDSSHLLDVRYHDKYPMILRNTWMPSLYIFVPLNFATKNNINNKYEKTIRMN